MSSICLAFCWSHLYRISDLFISQITPLYCCDGFPLSFLVSLRAQLSLYYTSPFFPQPKTEENLVELSVHFLTQFPLSWACLFLAQYLMNSPPPPPKTFYCTVYCHSPDCMDWKGSGLWVSKNLRQYGHGQSRLMKWVRSPNTSPLSIRMLLFRTPSECSLLQMLLALIHIYEIKVASWM